MRVTLNDIPNLKVEYDNSGLIHLVGPENTNIRLASASIVVHPADNERAVRLLSALGADFGSGRVRSASSTAPASATKKARPAASGSASKPVGD